MSKSDKSPDATIFLNDSNDAILKKFKKAVTDSGSEITDNCLPGIDNLIEIQSAVSDIPYNSIKERYLGKQYGVLKKETGELVIQLIEPIRAKTNELLQNPEKIIDRARRDGSTARCIAEEKIKQVKHNMGFL
jgi:tryptophanyl-tRNA synthetase